MPDRFYVSESSGYPIRLAATAGNARPITSVSVCDREHQHKTIATYRSTDCTAEFPPHRLGIGGAREYALAFCAELNADPALQYEPVPQTIFPEPSELGEAMVRASEWLDG